MNYTFPILPVLVFSIPLVVALLALTGLIKARRTWVRVLSGLTAITFLAVTVVIFWRAIPYLWAVHLEEKWRAAKPETKAQLESCLSLYTQHEIAPSESDWGRGYQLQPGERMVQYLIMKTAPLDVVYDASNRVIHIYTSYE